MKSQEPKKKRTKPTKRKTLVSNLDKYFSRFVRWSAADSDGNVKCATCDTIKHVKEMQNGHFQSRRHYSTRWLVKNCAVQCYGCNIGSQGQQFKFSKYLDMKYGPGTAQHMEDRAALSRKYTDAELKILGQYYKDKVDELINKHS